MFGPSNKTFKYTKRDWCASLFSLTFMFYLQLEDDCQCQVKTFPFQTFPVFIKMHAVVWQPLAIQVRQEFLYFSF